MAVLSANSASLAGTQYQPDWSPSVQIGNYPVGGSGYSYPISGGGTYSPQIGQNPATGGYIAQMPSFANQPTGTVLAATTQKTPTPLSNSNGGGNPSNNNNGQNNNASQFDSQQQALINAYNNMISTMEAQKPGLQDAYNQSMGIVNQQMGNNQKALEGQQQFLGTQNQLQQGQLGQSYQDQLAQNREIARSLGSFGSDYAQLQNRAGTSYGQNQMGLNNTFQGGMNSLFQQFNQANTALQQQQVQLGQQYNQSLRDIAMAEGQSDVQKLQAISNLQNNYNYMNSLIQSMRNYTNPAGTNIAGALGTTGQTTAQAMAGVPGAFQQANTYTPGQGNNGVAGGIETKKNQFNIGPLTIGY